MTSMARTDPKVLRILVTVALVLVLWRSFSIWSASRYAIALQEAESAASNVSVVHIEFPRKIWQTSKQNAVSLEEDDRKVIQSWLKLNQKHRYEIMTRYSAETYVKDKFVDRPDVVESFLDLQEPILRADFIRYLVLLRDGGVYADIDTKCRVPVDDWVPPEFRDHVGLVVGIEFDGRGESRWADWTRDLQFASWAMLAKPGHLALEIATNKAMRGIKQLAQQHGTTVADLKPSFGDILDTTGPSMFTDAVLESLSILTGTTFTWQNITGLEAPRLVADVLILPINGFGSGQQHSKSGSPEGEEVLVEHLFKGSWKTDHPLNPNNNHADGNEETQRDTTSTANSAEQQQQQQQQQQSPPTSQQQQSDSSSRQSDKTQQTISNEDIAAQDMKT